jgi:hypothetical protein
MNDAADIRAIPPEVAKAVLFATGAAMCMVTGEDTNGPIQLVAAARTIRSLSREEKIALGRFVAAMTRATGMGEQFEEVATVANIVDDVCAALAKVGKR